MKAKVWKPWHGAVFFLAVMAAFYLICVPLQTFFGMSGLAATELLLLVMAVLFAKIMKTPLRALFPVHRPSFVRLLGTLLIWFSSYLFALTVTLIQYRLFPEEMTEVGEGLSDFLYGSTGPLLTVFIVCILPAVCEEAVHRGVIIHSLYCVRREWLVVLLMGIYFGLFHSDPFRFLPTALLGAAMSYLMLETENMVYSSFFHAVNNLFPLLLEAALAGSQEYTAAQTEYTVETVPLATVGAYLFLSAAVPFGLYLGNYLLHRQKGVRRPFLPRGRETEAILGIAIPTAVLAALGLLLLGVGAEEILREMTP